MKNFKLASGLVLAALGLCGPVQADNFSIWIRSDGSEFMPKLVEAFNASSEHEVELQIVPSAELVQKYAIAAAGGSAPDALSLDLIYTPAFAEAGQLKDLTEMAQALPYFEHLSKAHIDVGTYDGKIYGLPFTAEGSVLLWNKDLYRQAGLDPDAGPTSWDEIRSAAQAIGALGDETYGFYFSGSCGGCNIFTFAPLVWATGGSIFADGGTKAAVDTPVFHEAVEFYRGMVNDGLVPAGAQTDPGDNFFAAFANGNIGLSSSGAFAIGALNNNFSDLDYGVTFLPGKDGEWSSFAGGDNFVVSASTEKLEPIAEFLDFAYSLEGQKILAANGSLPVRGDVAKDALAGLDPRYEIAAEAMANGRTPYSVVFNDLINSRNGPWISMLNQAFFAETEEEANEAIAEGQAEMQSIIDAAR